ncbi:MAG: MFS transporter, partial [Acholeplasmataceae bacterium]
MKLNYKKVFYVGLAFFLITIFWQTYDSIIAKILIDKFGLNHFWSGVVMALDNILALILLPLFGAISDRTNHKRGRRTPFVIVGTIVAAFAFMALTFVDNAQTTKINQTQIVEKYEASSGTYDVRKEVLFWDDLLTDMKTERDSALANNNIDQARYDKWHNDIYLKMQDQLANSDSEGKINAGEVAYLDGYYTTYLSNLAWEVTIQNPANLIIFIGILFVALIAMSLFRSPAVSLMPDVTIKPLRSKANAIINLMGAGAGVTSLILLTIFGLDGKSYVNYMWAFISVGTIMLIVLVIFLLKVNEPKLVQEKIKEDELYGITEEDEEDGEAEKMNELPKDKK